MKTWGQRAGWTVAAPASGFGPAERRWLYSPLQITDWDSFPQQGNLTLGLLIKISKYKYKYKHHSKSNWNLALKRFQLVLLSIGILHLVFQKITICWWILWCCRWPSKRWLASGGTSPGTDSEEGKNHGEQSSGGNYIGWLYLHHWVNVTLWPCELCWIFHLVWNRLFVESWFCKKLSPLSRLWTTDSSTCCAPCWHGPG